MVVITCSQLYFFLQNALLPFQIIVQQKFTFDELLANGVLNVTVLVIN